MSNHEKIGRLDGAIDDAVREMMQVDPRPGLRHRVAGSINARPERGGFRAGLAWAAALAVVVVASLMMLRSPEPARPAAAPQVVAVPPAVPVSPPAGPRAAVSPQAPAATGRRREPAPESIFGPRTPRVAAASVPTADLPAPAPSGLDAPIEPVPIASGAAPIAPIVLAPIRIAPLAIQPLTVSALPHRR